MHHLIKRLVYKFQHHEMTLLDNGIDPKIFDFPQEVIEGGSLNLFLHLAKRAHDDIKNNDHDSAQIDLKVIVERFAFRIDHIEQELLDYGIKIGVPNGITPELFNGENLNIFLELADKAYDKFTVMDAENKKTPLKEANDLFEFIGEVSEKTNNVT